MFFFSSRRRHTRWTGDWSSDVCSSDLVEEIASIEGLDEDVATELQSRATEALDRREPASREERRSLGVSDDLAEIPPLTRSEERRVGKECSSRWSPCG